MLRSIVEQARQGDEEAFAALVREVGDRCIYIAHRILRDANLAEDAVQITLVHVWRELPALRDLDRFEAWLHRILVNACYAEAKRGRHFAADVVLLETDAPVGADEFLTVHDRDQLDRGFRRLPAGPAGCPRLPLRPRADHARGRRPPRHSPRDGQVPIVLCNRGDPGGARSRRPDTHPRPGAAGMTKARDPEVLLTAYLAIGMDALPDRVADSVMDEVHRTRQRVVLGPWRTPTYVQGNARGRGGRHRRHDRQCVLRHPARPAGRHRSGADGQCKPSSEPACDRGADRRRRHRASRRSRHRPPWAPS